MFDQSFSYILAIAALVIGIMILMVLLQQVMSTDSNQITLRLIKSLMVVLIHIIFRQLLEVNVLAVMVG